MDDSRSSGRTTLPPVALLAANAVSLLGNVVALVAAVVPAARKLSARPGAAAP